MRSVTYLGVVLAALVVAAACTGDASLPFSPSSFSDAGATIVGTANVAGSGQSASFQSGSSFTTLAEEGSSGLTVQIVGTDITAEADDDGKFTLSGVPSGTIQLHFTGPGVDAYVTLTGVEPGQTIIIIVAVSGSSASVTSDARRSDSSHDDSSDDDLRVNGTVENLTVGCPEVTFTVGLDNVLTTASTRFDDTTCRALADGQTVEVRGDRDDPLGPIVATRIKGNLDEVRVSGTVSGVDGATACLDLTFFVGGETVTTSASTRFDDTTCSELVTDVGDSLTDVEVEVRGFRTADETLDATRVKRTDGDDDSSDDYSSDDESSDDDSSDDDSSDDNSSDDDSSGR